jgi:hypothetical protein
MADVVRKTNVKTAARELATPITDAATFDSIVQFVITKNPFGFVACREGGISHDPVEKTKEACVVRVVYQDALAKSVGTDARRFSRIAGFNAGAAALPACAPLAAAPAGTPVLDPGSETCSATLNCRDPNGELYQVAISRSRVSLASYSDDAIFAKVGTWADTVPALASRRIRRTFAKIRKRNAPPPYAGPAPGWGRGIRDRTIPVIRRSIRFADRYYVTFTIRGMPTRWGHACMPPGTSILPGFLIPGRNGDDTKTRSILFS